jgi:aminoglycoside 6'-N-acetyltransferase I
MRASLWPEAVAAELAREATRFLDGVPSVAEAVFVALDEANSAFGFIELGLRQFADGCESSPVPYVEGWFVEGEQRRRGAGKALMNAGERWARERGFFELASDTQIDNVTSRQAHAALGFAEVETLVILRKDL